MVLFLLLTRYEEIMREEKTTTQEIQALERKFEAWSQMTEPAVVRKPQQKPLASARDITKDLPKEVAQFEVDSNIYIPQLSFYKSTLVLALEPFFGGKIMLFTSKHKKAQFSVAMSE